MHSHENEPIVVQREVKAIAIPAGVEVNLKLASVGYITQALGGSFTVYIDGNLFRIAGKDADAIGLSLLSGAHLTLVPKIIELLAEAGRSDVLVIVGGIIPDGDIAPLEAAGVAKVFTPGSPLPEIGQWLGQALDEREEALQP